MTAQSLNNAYRSWLGIDATSTPTHYQLLGIAEFESNPQAIVAAHASRSGQLSAHLSGPEAEVARKILSDLSAAQSCLLDPAAKAAYDQKLQQSASPTLHGSDGFRPSPRSDAHLSDGHVVAPPAAVTAAATSSSVEPPAKPMPVSSKSGDLVDEPLSAVPWLIGGVCAGLLGVAVLAMVLFAVRRDKPSVAEIDNNNTNNVSVANTLNEKERDKRNVRQENRGRRSSGGDDDVAPPVGTPDHLTWDHDPDVREGDVLDVDRLNSTTDSTTDPDSGSETVVETTVPVDAPAVEEKPLRLASVPRSVALPKRDPDDLSSIAPAVLTRVDVDDPSDVDLKLPEGPLAGGNGRFKITIRESSDSSARTWDVKHVTDDSEATVGQYNLTDGELSFAWAPDADPDVHSQLENLPLKITSGEEVATIAQRQAGDTEPIVVKVDAGAIDSTVALENPPQDSDVVVSIEDLGDEFGDFTWEPSNAVEVGKTSILRFGDENDPYQLALQVSVEQAGPNRVRIETRPMFRQAGTKKWDYFRPKKAEETLVALQQQQALLDAQMQAIQRQFRRDPVKRDQATAIHNQQSARILEHIAALERISDRCLELQDQARMHFRVYADTEDGEIDLVRTKKSPEDNNEQTTSDEPTDPNIGAPVKPDAEDAAEDPPADEAADESPVANP